MSMVSPDYYIQEITKGKSYVELIEIRNEFIKSFEDFEKKYVFNTETVEKPMIHPLPEVVYQVNMDYLIELLKVMQEKYYLEHVETECEGGIKYDKLSD